jgi:hypothetical protein
MFDFFRKKGYVINLFVLGQIDKHRDDVRLKVLHLDSVGELAQFGGSRTPDHWGVILTQSPELITQIGCLNK